MKPGCYARQPMGSKSFISVRHTHFTKSTLLYSFLYVQKKYTAEIIIFQNLVAGWDAIAQYISPLSPTVLYIGSANLMKISEDTLV